MVAEERSAAAACVMISPDRQSDSIPQAIRDWDMARPLSKIVLLLLNVQLLHPFSSSIIDRHYVLKLSAALFLYGSGQRMIVLMRIYYTILISLRNPR